jgi:hypothetical protein
VLRPLPCPPPSARCAAPGTRRLERGGWRDGAPPARARAAARRTQGGPRTGGGARKAARALRVSGLLATAALLPGAATLPAQTPPRDAGWNAPRALELLERGRAARQGLVDDGSLQSYQALTEGHIYFYVDPEEGERALIRVDQVAVELFWEAPDLVRQRIVGERSENRLPVRDFRYYLDRLTLVQYGFGDEIRVGQGMDVADVPHPLAPPRRDAEGRPREYYDVRLADSVALRLPGQDEALRILELELRPRDPERPGVLGSIHLNAADGQLVRMAFTFTPASYVDPRTDRIRVELDYGLWEGRYWLPNRQEIEVRREIPEFDVGVGTVIRAVLRVGGYELNTPLPDFLRAAPAVSQAPEEVREAFAFREGLFDALDRDGMAGVATRVDPAELRAEVTRRLRNRPPTGLSPVRLALPDLSSLVRADRARGVTVGLGTSIRPAGAVVVRGWGGWSIAPGTPSFTLEASGPVGDASLLRFDGTWRGRGDLGVRPAVAGVVGSVGALALGEDYLDPFERSHAGLTLARQGASGVRMEVGAGVVRDRSEVQRWSEAPLSSGRSFRAVRPVDDGVYGRAHARLTRRLEGLGYAGWGGAAGATLALGLGGELLVGRTDPPEGRALGAEGLLLEGNLELRRRPLDGRSEVRVALQGGARVAGSLAQQARYLGGRGTVPGFDFREVGGSRWILAGVSASREMGTPWVRLRGGVDAGWAGGDPDTAGRILGARAGVGLFYDLLRVEVARGLTGPGARWQFSVGIDPLWWDRL